MFQALIGVSGAAIALVTLYFIKRQADEIKRQTDLQRKISETAAQPYVWADVRVDERGGWFLNLVIGNSGPTVATNVRVRIDPPIPGGDGEQQSVETAHRKLAEGLSSLAPGRTLLWTLGPSTGLVNRDSNTAHRIQIDCDGPYGPVKRAEYTIDFANFPESIAPRPGTLHGITQAVEKLAKQLPDALRPLRVQIEDD